MVVGVGVVWIVSLLAALGCGGSSGTGMSRAGGGGTGGVGGATGVAAGSGIGGVASRNLFVDTITQKSVDKIDLLFMIDNSLSMADKQEVLKEAVPDLVQRLVSPNCVDTTTGANSVQLTDPGADCPSGKTREFTPIRNIHVGVITSSLGDHGDNSTCLGKDGGSIRDEEQDDHGHLIATRPRFAAEPLKAEYGPTFQPAEPAGFLDWNPSSHLGQEIHSFITTFQMMVTASGQFGCGLPAQLESIYRFLVDPEPPSSIEKRPCAAGSGQSCAFPTGKDTALLAQRAAFLRPDSLLTVFMVSGENDCSIRDERQFFYAATSPTKVLLPHGSAACATNPNDPCCYSCGGTPPPSCAKDPSCTPPTSDAKSDVLNLRCFDEKRRFGLDFLYPTKRYVNALTKPQLCLSNPDLGFDPSNAAATCASADTKLVQNPLFQDLTGAGVLPRDPSLVYLAGIVGVPWQDLQATSTDEGLSYPANELHYKVAQQLNWDLILGAPASSPPVPPTDGLMVESRYPRGGEDVAGRALVGPNTPIDQNNPINGHDFNNVANDDLMYACIFPLKAPKDCTEVEKADPSPGCDCGAAFNPADNNPLCENPVYGTYGNTQYSAKAYPGLRELSVLRDFGDNAIVASICARNLRDPAAQDYGYRPAVDAIVDRLKGAFVGRCLPRKLAPDAKTGEIPCSIVEARPEAGGDCNAAQGRSTPTTEIAAAVRARMTEKGICGGTSSGPACSAFTLCEIAPLNSTAEDPTQACHHDGVVEPKAGWCYVDPSANSSDDASLVANCRASEQRIIRFVDPQNATPAEGAQILISCSGAPITDTMNPGR
jgi:hypothetical protein